MSVLPYINVEGKTFAEAYHKLLLAVYEEGITSEKESYAFQTEKDVLFRECESRFEVLDFLEEPMFSRAMPGLPDFPQYIEDILLGTKDYLVAKGIYTYTYHERIFVPEIEGGQLAEAIRKLGKHPYSNRVQVVIWRVPKDNLMESGQPCLQRIWFKIFKDEKENNVLRLHVYFRSRDLGYAFNENVVGMKGVAKLVMDCLNDHYGLNIKRINYVDHCDSLHIYGKDAKEFERTVNLLRKRKEEELFLESTDPFLQRLWKGRNLFDAVEKVKEEIFDPIFKK